METTIQADQLTRNFGSRTAVDGVSFVVPKGEIFALLGPNGSGKTTTVRLLNGILQPDGGGVRVCGFDPAQEAEKVHALSGVMTETAACYGNLSGLDNLLFFGRMHNMQEADCRQQAEKLLAVLDLTSAAGRPVKTWSTGMKKRLALARTLIHRPEVLFLDEPTDGLDPESARDVLRLIRDLRTNQGVTVFLCTHQLRYAHEITTRCGFMHQGKLLAAGTVMELAAARGMGNRLILRGVDLPEFADAICRESGEFQFPAADDLSAAERIAQVIAGGGKIFEARQESPDLEDLYFAWLAGNREEA